MLAASLAHGDREIAISDGFETDRRAADVQCLRTSAKRAAVYGAGDIVHADGTAGIANGTHAGTKIATAGATGTVTILSGAGKSSIALQPTGDNVMLGEGSYKSAADMKAIVAITLACKPGEQARFTPLAGNRP